jgi:anhydro-N-acetylmuramic acid kinase
MKKIRALGIMNGTSLDGIDYSLIEADANFNNIVFKKHSHKKIPDKLREQLLSAAQNKLTTYSISELHFDLGRLYSAQIKQLKKTWAWDIVGLHGQTVYHHGRKATFQIGSPQFIAQNFNCPVYFDFRAADIADGGQGAPFAPFFQKKLIKDKNSCIAFHNLGGISNLTLFNKNKIQAFDTGPANILIDSWVQSKKLGLYDKNGLLAAKGIPEPISVNHFLNHPYFKLKPPKSTGREDFNLDFIKKWQHENFKNLNLNDQLATLVELTALSIANAYLSLKTMPKIIYFYGGGIYNSYLMERIQFNLPDVKISTTDALGWPSQAFEASIFAFLGAARHFDIPVHLPEVTGAKKVRKLGSLYF